MQKLDEEKAKGRPFSCVGGNFTTQPVAASWGVDPEFVDFAGLYALYGIKRSLGYQLIAQGLIRSVTLRRRGALKGKRLIDARSVRELIAAAPEKTSARFSKEMKRRQKMAAERRAAENCDTTDMRAREVTDAASESAK